MRKVAGILFVVVLAMSLMLLPAPAFAADLAGTCDFDQVKWEDNPDSCFLYLNNWGKTPITAMSRLAGLAYPNVLIGECVQLYADPGSCYGNCACCNDEAGSQGCCTDPGNCEDANLCPGGECEIPPADPSGCSADAVVKDAHCAACWGVSLAFAGKSWAGCDLSPHPRLNQVHPNHFGNSNLGNSADGGDWGNTGCPHSECASCTWCATDNFCADCQ